MQKLTCAECPCCYKGEDGEYPYCHFERRTVWDIPPCEYEDEYEYEYEYDYEEEWR